MLDELKKSVYEANIELVKRGVVLYTWGNVSGADESHEYMVIKPSGVPYDAMTWKDMVVMDIKAGKVIEGSLKPSSDAPTHIELYRAWDDIKGVAHTHSKNAVAFAQAGMSIPILGTTHADYFFGDIPCTRSLREEEVLDGYETNTGRLIVEEFNNNGIDPLSMPGILVNGHGPFSWGDSPKSAVYHSVVMDYVAEIAIKTLTLNNKSELDDYIIKKHYERKHGKNAYYGQSK